MDQKKYCTWDAHVHLFPERMLEAVWQWFENFGVDMPYRGISHRDLTAELAGMGVEKAFLLLYAHRPGISLELNRWLHGFCLENPIYLPFGCVHPGDENLGLVIEEALDKYNFHGFKLHFLVLEMRADDPSFTPIYRALEKRGKTLVVHASTAPIQAPWLGMDTIEPVLAAHPGLNVQIAHLGHFELERAAALMEKYPRLYLDTAWGMGNSSIEVDPAPIRELILEFPDRVVYGSDFPIIMEDPRLTVDRILDLSLPEKINEAVLAGNASKMIGWSGRPQGGSGPGF